MTLPASALLAQGIGVPVALGGTGQPLPDGQFIQPATVVPGVLLYPDEVAGIEEFIADYNAIIASQIAGVGGIVVDINAIFDDISAHGYHLGGINLSTSFLSGGIFSADGVHPSSIGYTIIANAFIQTHERRARPRDPGARLQPRALHAERPADRRGRARNGGEWHYSLGMWRDAAGAHRRRRAVSRSRCRRRPPPGPAAAGRAASSGTDSRLDYVRPGPGDPPGAFFLQPAAGFC